MIIRLLCVCVKPKIPSLLFSLLIIPESNSRQIKSYNNHQNSREHFKVSYNCDILFLSYKSENNRLLTKCNHSGAVLNFLKNKNPQNLFASSGLLYPSGFDHPCSFQSTFPT